FNSPMAAAATGSLSPGAGEKRHWWNSNRKVVERYVREARMLLASREQRDVAAAVGLLDAALAADPRMEMALEMKARCLLSLRRFKDVADMLYESIPSFKMGVSDESSSSGSSENSSTGLTRERAKLLSGGGEAGEEGAAVKCFSVADLKRKVLAGYNRNVEKEDQWRFLVLGQACCHLGLMEDAMVLLQAGKRLAAAAFRRESVSLSDDIFSFNKFPLSGDDNTNSNPPKSDSENVAHLLSHVKLLLRRKTAAIAALDAGLYPEAIRHFSKILDGRRGAPQGFLSEIYVLRASAYQSAGRIADAISDCNKSLALDTCCIEALTVRASLFETIRCFPDSLHDLEHLKLLYNSILRDKKLPGPIWKRLKFQYREIPGKLCSLGSKIQQLKQKLAAGETGDVDYHSLMGLRRGCSRTELERSHLLLTLKHKPDKSAAFVERCEFTHGDDADSVRDRAKMSSLLLHRLIQKGHANLISTVLEEEAAEKQRKKNAIPAASPPASVFQGIFCRDLAVVGNLLSQAGGFNRSIPLKYEALSC
ncbi:hypothetical protein M569_14373, partial [Genlisea aurea]